MIPKRDPPTLKNPQLYSSDFNSFIASCLQKEPQDRLNAKELLNHPFIRIASSKSELKNIALDCREVIETYRYNKSRTEVVRFQTFCSF
jgi:serine/threonine protein kinase